MGYADIWPPPEEEGIIVPRILVVDDDPMVCATVEVCLTRKGFEVTVPTVVKRECAHSKLPISTSC
jgi:PleD family two-component response regulator